MRIKLTAAMTLAAGALMAAGLALPAHAGVSTSPEYTAKGTGSVAGYFANGIGVNFTHIQGRMGGNGGDGAISHLGVGPVNGAGIGMCDAGTGVAAQLGDVNLGGGKMNVSYGVGVFGAAVQNDDRCQNGVVANPPTGVLLAGIPSSHSVDLSILYDAHHAHNGCLARQVRFEAVDLSNPASLKESPCITMPVNTDFTEIDAGVVADAELLSAPADVPLVTFAHLLASANLDTQAGTVHGSFQTIPQWNVFPVICTNDGTPSGTVLLNEGPFASDHFHLFSGSAVS